MCPSNPENIAYKRDCKLLFFLSLILKISLKLKQAGPDRNIANMIATYIHQ